MIKTLEPTKIAQQMIDFQKNAFENSFNAMVVFQGQAEKMTDAWLSKNSMIPEEGQKAISEWMLAYKERPGRIQEIRRRELPQVRILPRERFFRQILIPLEKFQQTRHGRFGALVAFPTEEPAMKTMTDSLTRLWLGGFDPTKLFSPDAALSQFSESMEQSWRMVDSSTQWIQEFLNPPSASFWPSGWPPMPSDWESRYAEFWKLMGLVPKDEVERTAQQLDAAKKEVASLKKEATTAKKQAKEKGDKATAAEKKLKTAEARIKELEADMKKKAVPEPEATTSKKPSRN